ncbi:MAG: N-acetylmuramic acid 6-phosphate etherase [Terricaulis sp.]
MNTEDISPRYLDLDLWENIEALKALHESQLTAVGVVAQALPAMAAAVDDAIPRLRAGGRLIYAGAGTSARIAVQDGAELGPTFGWPSDRLAFAIAGGEDALLRAIENAEDSNADGSTRIKELEVGLNDIVLGLAASGETPFTVSVVEAARARGALTIGVANNAGSHLLRVSEHPILVETGAEPVAGSTRLKAGTAQKVVLNLFSTLVMVRLGKVYRALMVDMRPTNDKLRRRAVQMVSSLALCDEPVAAAALVTAEGHVKLAALIARGLHVDDARALLAQTDGNLRSAVAALQERSS